MLTDWGKRIMQVPPSGNEAHVGAKPETETRMVKQGFPNEQGLQLGAGPLLTMLHVSDLHFVAELTEEGRRLWGKQFVRSHSFAKIYALAQTLYDLQRTGTQIDITMVTGDISTDGSKESLQTALNFIGEADIHRQGRLISKGLAAPAGKRVVIPGNHDRYSTGLIPIQTGSTNLEDVFHAPQKYPYAMGFPGKASENEASVILFVFDSTLPDWTDAPIISRIAQGKVLDAECDWLVSQSHEIARKNMVETYHGRQLNCTEATPRVALLHHHPIQVQVSDSKLTRLRNGEKFVEACFRAKINLVLFGHEHVEYFESKHQRGHNVHFMCCPSTSEYKSDPAGFFVLNLHERGFQVSVYHWQKATGIFGHINEHSVLWADQTLQAIR